MKLIYKRFIPYTVGRHFTVLFGCSLRFDTPSEFAYVLYNEQYPVGCVYGELINCVFDRNTGEIKHDIVIHKFEIRRRQRGKGYGRVMYEQLVEKLKPNEVTLCYLDENALNFWKHMGFKKRKGTDELYYKFK